MNIEKFQEEMDKKFGENALIEMDGELAEVEVISTGLPSLDLALGVGGFPRGRVIEIFGPEGAGKTTVALKAMAEAQRLGGTLPRTTYPHVDVKPLTGRVGLIDVEHGFDPSLAKLHGLKMGKGSGFFFSQPSGGDEALQLLEYMVSSGLFDIITVDSVAGLTTLDEQKSNIGDKLIATTAQLMSAGLKKLVGLINKSRTVVIFINQIREKPAVLYGSPETTTGGRALKYYSSVRLRISKGEQISEGSQQIGHILKIRVVKNKVAPPFETTEIDLYYRASDKKGKEAGFDVFSDLIKTAKSSGVVELAGSQYRYIDKETGEVHKASGLVAWKAYLEQNSEIMDKITNEMLGGINHVTE